MKKIILLLTIAFIIGFSQVAFASFTVNWCDSWDPGWTSWTYYKGYEYTAKWLVDNHYYPDMATATEFAKTGYIGYDTSDTDPYYWTWPLCEIEMVFSEIAGYKDVTTFGYYLQNDPANKTQIFSGPDGVGAKESINVSEPFGFYIHSPYPQWPPVSPQTYWYTDRFLNYSSQLHHTQANPGEGDAQALIYELKPGWEWLIAWEDLDATNFNSVDYTDNDYNDMFVKVTAIPEPATLSLLGLGLLGLLGLRKKK